MQAPIEILEDAPKNSIKKLIKRILKITITLAIDTGILLLIALAYIVPKDRKLIVFSGRDYSGFLDNIKYLYLYLYSYGYDKKYKIYFIGHRDQSLPLLKQYAFNVVKTPSLKAYWLYLRCNVLIADNAHWTTMGRYWAAYKAKKIQLWHGIGFKKIRVMIDSFNEKSKGIMGFFRYKLTGQLAVYDTFVSTSKFYTEKVFEPAFSPKNIVELGYPRNDVLFDNINFKKEHLMINTDKDCFDKVLKLRKEGKKIILFTPTFRGSKKFEIDSGVINFEKLDKFCKRNNFIIVFKMHPLPTYDIDFSKYDNILEYGNKNDVYPLFKHSDLMITDYSSIYTDYLLLNKPVIFFPYDYDDYILNCREIQFDYDWIIPGEKAMTQNELEDSLYRHLILKEDKFKKKRKEIRNMSWEIQDGKSCQHIWKYLEKTYIK